MHINFMLVFDVIVFFLGIYVVYQSERMKKEGKVPEMFVSSQEMKRCINERGFIQFLYPKSLGFGIVCVLFGVEGFYNDFIYDLGNAVNAAVIIIFIGVWIYFSLMLRKGRNEYFR